MTTSDERVEEIRRSYKHFGTGSDESRQFLADLLSHIDQQATRLANAKAAHEETRRALAEAEASLALQSAASKRARERWQKDHPNLRLTWPDQADLIVYLLNDLTSERQKREAAEKRAEEARSVLRELHSLYRSEQEPDALEATEDAPLLKRIRRALAGDEGEA